MVWCYCSICGESGKAVSAQTERLHRQEHTKRVHSINTKQEEIREPILSTSQSFNVSISSSEDLTSLFSASNIEQRIEQEIEHEAEHEEIEHEAEYKEIEHEAEQEIDNEELVSIKNISRKKFKEVALNYSFSENNNEFEQKNNLFSIKDTELLDDIELEDSDK